MTSTAPPQDRAAEEAVLGSLLVSGALWGAVAASGLKPGDFYHRSLASIFAAEAALAERGTPIDEITVAAALEDAGDLESAGGRDRLAVLARQTPAPGNAGHNAEIVRKRAIERRERGVYQAGLAGELDREDAVERLISLGGTSGHNGVEAIRRALLDEAQDTRAAEGPARVEVPGGAGMLHRGVPAMLYGGTGCGKSTVALSLGVSAAVAGERVLYLDRENGAPLTAERVEGLLDANPEWSDPLDDGRFVGRHFPELDPSWGPADYAEAIAGAGFSVVIYDSTREMLAQGQHDPDREDEWTAFLGRLVTPLTNRGVAVLLLDNVGHEATERPKGSRSKLDSIPQGYLVKTTAPFSPVEVGRISIECRRSRYGDDGREWTMEVGDGAFEVPTAKSEPPEAKRARDREGLRDGVLRAALCALREEAPLGRKRLVEKVREQGVKGRTLRIQNLLPDLAADPTSGLVHDEKAGFSLAEPPLTPTRGVTPGSPPLGPPDPAGGSPPSGGAPRVGPDPESAGRGVGPCRFDEHRDRGMDWVVADGSLRCGVCHPRAKASEEAS